MLRTCSYLFRPTGRAQARTVPLPDHLQTCKLAYPQTRVYPFSPVVVMPSVKYCWVKKYRIRMGATTMVAIAIAR
jgi:hypothetical protein